MNPLQWPKKHQGKEGDEFALYTGWCFHIFFGEMQRGLRKLLGGFKFQIFFYVHPYLGEMIQCD